MLAVSLAGCAETAEPAATEAPELVEGTLRGVVVDAAIVPVAGAQVILVGTAFETTTDVDGVFSFSGVPPGTYVLEVSTLIHEPTQVTVVIGDGPAEPVKVQLERRFAQDPYLEQQEIQGYMNCGYSIGLSSPCILDYTQLLPVCPGGCVPQLYGISGDIRRFEVPIEAGWQSRVNEIVWRPSTGTSESLSMTVSFYDRTSSHSYDGAAGPSPLRHQMDMDSERTHPDWIPPEGKEDYLVFVNPSASGSTLPFAVMIEQNFELFVSTFSYGSAPGGWSFVAGDGNPF